MTQRRFSTEPPNLYEMSLAFQAARGDVAALAEFLEARKLDAAWAPAHEAMSVGGAITLFREALAAAYSELDRWEDYIGGEEPPPVEQSWPDLVDGVHL
jgi:hypothetical protein